MPRFLIVLATLFLCLFATAACSSTDEDPGTELTPGNSDDGSDESCADTCTAGECVADVDGNEVCSSGELGDPCDAASVCDSGICAEPTIGLGECTSGAIGAVCYDGDNCVHETCDAIGANSGLCICPVGFQGADCEACADGFFGTYCDCTQEETDLTVASGSQFLTNQRFSPDGSTITAIGWDGFGVAGLRGFDLCGEAVDVPEVSGTIEGVMSGLGFSPDGTEIYFMGDDAIMQASTTGAPSQVLAEPDAMDPDVSPDGTLLVFRGDRDELKTFDLVAGGSATGLGIDGRLPRFSPDGTQIAFVDGDHVRVHTLKSAFTETLVTLDGFLSVDWFPAGDDRLAVTTATGIEAVSLVDASRTVLEEVSAARQVDVSPDGSTIIYNRNGQRSVYLIRGF